MSTPTRRSFLQSTAAAAAATGAGLATLPALPPVHPSGGDELKVVVPQAGIDLAALEALDFQVRRVQPMDGPDLAANTEWAVHWCLAHPRWQLSLQTHKLLGIR